MFEPGSTFEYGNSAEWLGLILPSLVGVSTEQYFQENILRPLGMADTTFYPFGEELKDRLVPLRFNRDGGYEVLTHQLPLLTLPRRCVFPFFLHENFSVGRKLIPRTEDIEYPVAGGGIYSTSRDYIKLLSHLLSHYASLTGGAAKRPEPTLLSDASVRSLFERSLPDAALPAMAKALSNFMAMDGLQTGEGDWSTGMALYLPSDGRRAPNGRHAGSAGWGGAAGTTYWVDPVAGVAVSGGRGRQAASTDATTGRVLHPNYSELGAGRGRVQGGYGARCVCGAGVDVKWTACILLNGSRASEMDAENTDEEVPNAPVPATIAASSPSCPSPDGDATRDAPPKVSRGTQHRRRCTNSASASLSLSTSHTSTHTLTMSGSMGVSTLIAGMFLTGCANSLL